MSCRTTPAGSAWTTIARLESGLTDVQTLSTFHALRREGNGVAAPTADEWDQFVDDQIAEVDVNEDISAARRRSLTNRLNRAGETIPDGPSWYALRNIRERANAEASNVETHLRGLASLAGQDYDAVAARYNTYLNEVDRGRSVTAPEGYETARDSWRRQGLPADHGTYTALTRIAAELRESAAETANDTPRRIEPVAFPNSNAIHSAGYDPHDGRLEVTFRRRDRATGEVGTSRTYAYHNVPPEVWQEMCNGSAGSVYTSQVRNHSEYRYASVEEEEAGAHRRCANCGQWWSPSHTCPIPAPGEPVSTAVPSGRERTREEHLAVGAEISQYLDENPVERPVVSQTRDGRARLVSAMPTPAANTDSDYEARVRYLEEVEGMTTSDAQSAIEAEDRMMEHEAASRAADLADQAFEQTSNTTSNTDDDDDAAFVRCPNCGEYMDGSHSCTPRADTDETWNRIADVVESIENNDAAGVTANTDELIADLRERLTGSRYPDGGREPSMQELQDGPDEALTATTASVAPRSLGDLDIAMRDVQVNRGSLAPVDRGYTDVASVPDSVRTRVAAGQGPVLVPVSFRGTRAGDDNTIHMGGDFEVTGNLMYHRPEENTFNLSDDAAGAGLRCNCLDYANTYHCEHVDEAMSNYWNYLVPGHVRDRAARNGTEPYISRRTRSAFEDVPAESAAAPSSTDTGAPATRCPQCGQFAGEGHTCPPPPDLSERFAATAYDEDGDNRAQHMRESRDIEEARGNLASFERFLAQNQNGIPNRERIATRFALASDIEALDRAFEAIPSDHVMMLLHQVEGVVPGTWDTFQTNMNEEYLSRRAALASTIDTDGTPTASERPEPVTTRMLGITGRRARMNGRRTRWTDPNHYDRGTLYPAAAIRTAAGTQPVIVPVDYSGRRSGNSSDGLPNGYFSVSGSVVYDRPARGQHVVSPRELRCSCPEYQENYDCPHISYTLAHYRRFLLPATSTPASVDPAAAQAAAEAAMRADWMRSEEHAAEARARHAAASAPEDSYTGNFEAFENDHNEALARKARGEEPVPYMTENATNGVFTRESGRGFGVEMEFDFPPSMDWSDRNAAIRAIGQEMYDAGLTPVPQQQGYHASAARGYTDQHAQGWSFERDCTVSGEIVSPVMYDEPETWANIEKVCDIIRRHGGIANAKTGSHVHVGAPNMTPQAATELMSIANQHEDVMYRLSQNPDKPKHRPMRWCGPNNDVPQGGYTSMSQVSMIRSHAYGMNLGGVHGGSSDHPEIRYWDGTLNPAVIQAQVKISGGMVTAAERNASLGQSRRNREPVGSHATRLQAVRGNSRRALTSDELSEDSATVRSFVDTLFTRREDKAQAAALFAVTRWQKGQ
jgi:hypothetical protein